MTIPSGASSVKNGPRTELAVPPETLGLFSPSTRADTPRTSERRMNSCLIGVQVWPVRVRKLMAVIHSSVVRLLRVRIFIFLRKIACSRSPPGLSDELMKVSDQTSEDESGSSVSIVMRCARLRLIQRAHGFSTV